LLNWIDDRNEVQGHAHAEEYFSIRDAHLGWEEKLNRDRVELVCIEVGAPLVAQLRKQSHDADLAGAATGGAIRFVAWREVYKDTDAAEIHGTVIFERFLDKPH
jgi:hypothetical protein